MYSSLKRTVAETPLNFAFMYTPAAEKTGLLGFEKSILPLYSIFESVALYQVVVVSCAKDNVADNNISNNAISFDVFGSCLFVIKKNRMLYN